LLRRYQTVQRFFGEQIPWVQLYWQFFVAQLYQPEREYILAGDECVVTKSGKQTYGLDHFFSGLLSKVVPSIAIFALSLIDVEERRSYPIRVEQVIRSETEKAAAQAKKQQRKAKQKAKVKGKPGRPKGSQNRDKTQVELTEELLRIQKDGQTTVGHLPGRAFDPLSGAGWTLWQQQRSTDGASVWSAPGLQTAS
jgi:hypothetical protein